MYNEHLTGHDFNMLLFLFNIYTYRGDQVAEHISFLATGFFQSLLYYCVIMFYEDLCFGNGK